MNAISPMLANGIDLPLLLFWGVAVFVPLMLFQIGVEGAILSRCWQIRFRELMTCVFLANCWSLLAGIPVKIFNAWLYSLMLPTDLAGFFARYPYAVTLGTLVYFFVTWLVEARYSMKWLGREGHTCRRSRVWSHVLLANLATYAVLGPVHYFATRPTHNIQEFTEDTRWAHQPPTLIIYIDTGTSHLKSILSDGSNPATIVPFPVVDYQVSADLNLCLFRGPEGSLQIFRRDANEPSLVWQTNERFHMDNVAFSPSGRFVAWFNESAELVEIVDMQTSNRWSASLASDGMNARVAWSTEESRLMISTRDKTALMQLAPEGALRELPVAPADLPALLPVYGRVGGTGFSSSGGEWKPVYRTASFAEWQAWTFPGLSSSLRISRTNRPPTRVVWLAVNPGLLHIAHYDFWFTHPSFLGSGKECLFETRTDIYLLEIERRRLGRVVHGHSFILLLPRYAKQLL